MFILRPRRHEAGVGRLAINLKISRKINKFVINQKNLISWSQHECYFSKKKRGEPNIDHAHKMGKSLIFQKIETKIFPIL